VDKCWLFGTKSVCVVVGASMARAVLNSVL
jgi:hypothetical protein